MGVTGLWKLIEQSGKPVPLDTLENKILAVDISIWLHQVVKGFQDSNGATLPHAHLLGLFHRLCKLMYYRIKPVFVFDGGVPPLKRETIAKRARNKNKYQSEADKLQQLLLEALAKEKVVQQALGPSTSALLTSPKKPIKKTDDNDADNDLFKLPPMKEDLLQNTDESYTDITTESDSSFDEKHRTQYNHNLQSIDVKSSYFQSLPADIRHEILSDIKETRKQSSWGRLHELPVESQSFSTFQMKRLLKRRQVQVELEEAEKEMGGKGLSMAELENLLSEEGVVDVELATERIASNEHVRYLHVRDITKAMKKETTEVKTEIKKIEPIPEEDLDLQRAIQLSLDPEISEINNESDQDDSNDMLRLTTQQRRAFATTATSLARNYMLEYGGLNDEEITDLVKLDESMHTTQEFKFNDDSILIGNGKSTVVSSTVTKEANAEQVAPIELSDQETEESVSSDADSEFIDVPELDSDTDPVFVGNSKKSLPPPFLMNKPPIPSACNSAKDSGFEVSVNPNAICDANDDIFADVFNSIKSKSESPKQPENEQESITIVDVEDEAKNESIPEIKPVEDSKIKSILNNLDAEMSSITKLSLSNLSEQLPTSKEVDKPKVFDKDVASKEPTTPPKITQPFFVRKTPPSSQKKLTASQSKQDVTSPSKASKSLLDTFESLPSTSTAGTIDESETLMGAANVLREKKSKIELEEIADQLNKERRELATEINKKDRLGISITEQMSMECMELLRLFGVPYIVAPMEAEAQCAYLNEINLSDGTITDDSDIWLFGGKTVYKNFFDQNKLVMEFKSNQIETLFHLNRRKLIQLSFLVGSDYTQGIHGIGAVTALEVLSIFTATPEKDGETTETMSTLSSLRKFRDWWQHKNVTQRTVALRNKLKNITITEDFPNPRVVEAYLYPTVDENRERFTWGHPDAESIREYTKKTFGWTKKRTDEILMPVMKRLNEKVSQTSIQNYFKITDVTSRKDLKVSKRVRIALDKMSGTAGDGESDEDEDKEVEKPKKVKLTKAKQAAKKSKSNEDGSSPKKSNEKASGKSIAVKTSRKRKPAVDESGPSTSSSSSSTVKKVILPDNNTPIPQREKDKEIMESRKQKAIQILKASKK